MIVWLQYFGKCLCVAAFLIEKIIKLKYKINFSKGELKMKKFSRILAIFVVLAMVLSVNVFADSAAEYVADGYHPAVIANGDVYIVGDAMYIEGSVYSNGNIYVGNGAGNEVQGLFISGTESTLDSGYGTTEDVLRNGYIHVDDDYNESTNAYSTAVNYNGAIHDENTSFEYSYEVYTAPVIANYVETAEANQYGNVLTVSEDTHFGTVNAASAGFIIDATQGDVTVVIDTLNVTGGNPYIQVVGSNHVNLYVNNWVQTGDIVNVDLMTTDGDCNNWDTADQWAYISNSIYTLDENNIPRPNDTVLSALNPSQIDFYVNTESGVVDFEGARIAANIHTNANSLFFGYNLEIYGNIESGAATFETASSGYVNGIVSVPNATSTVHNSSCIQGQLITDTLVINGAGSILWAPDYATESDDPEETADPTVTPGSTDLYLDIVEDVIYVVGGNDYEVNINHSGDYHWELISGDYYPNATITDENGTYVTDIYNDTTGSHSDNTIVGTTNAWYPGEFTLVAVSNEDGTVLDQVKIIVVSSEDEIPTATPVPSDDPIDESVYETLGAKVIWYDVDAGTYELGRINLIGHTPLGEINQDLHYTVLNEGTYYTTDEKLSDEDWADAVSRVTRIEQITQKSLDNNVKEETLSVFGRIDSNGWRESLSITPYAYQQIQSEVGYNMYLCIADGNGNIKHALMIIDESIQYDDSFSGNISPLVFDFHSQGYKDYAGLYAEIYGE